MTPAAESILFDSFASCMQVGWDAENLPFSYGVEIRSPRASRATDRLKLLCIPSSPLMSTHSPSTTTQSQHSATNCKWSNSASHLYFLTTLCSGMDPPRAVQRRHALCRRLRLAVEEARRVASITRISPFLKLPNEVMENVLIHLPPQQIARSREVSRGRCGVERCSPFAGLSVLERSHSTLPCSQIRHGTLSCRSDRQHTHQINNKREDNTATTRTLVCLAGRMENFDLEVWVLRGEGIRRCKCLHNHWFW